MERYTFETDFYGTHVLRLDENSHAVRLKDTHAQYCLASEVDSELAALRTDHNDLIIEIRGEHAEALASKDRDLADANHALLLANNSADAFRRVAERHKRAIDWLLRHGAFRRPDGVIEYRAVSADMDVTGAEFADIIVKPTTGASPACNERCNADERAALEGREGEL